MSSSSDAHALTRRRVALALGIALSLMAHIIILAALVFGVRQAFEAGSTPVANVELIPAWPNSVHRKAQSAKSRDRRAPEDSATTARPRQLPDKPAQLASPVEPPLAQSPSIPSSAQAIQPTLRLGFGCDHAEFMRLTEEERATCRERFATRGKTDHDYADAGIDPNARAAFDSRSKAETFLRSPFLSAMPKKGCRPRVTEHDAAAYGKSQPDFTVQATCVVHF